MTTEKQSSDKIVLRRPNLRQRSDIKYQRDSKAVLVEYTQVTVTGYFSINLFHTRFNPRTKRYSDLLLHVVPLSPLSVLRGMSLHVPSVTSQCHQAGTPGTNHSPDVRRGRDTPGVRGMARRQYLVLLDMAITGKCCP